MKDQLAARTHRLRLRHLIIAPVDHDVLVRFRRDVAAAASG
jgi:hypothetical protein